MLWRALVGDAPRWSRGAAALVLEALLACLAGRYLVVRGGVPTGLALLTSAVPVSASAVAIWTAAAERRPAFALLPPVLGLNLLGLITLTVIAPSFAWRQCLWSLLGLATYFVLATRLRSVARLPRWVIGLCLGSIVLLGSTFVFGTHPSGPGAKQWLPLGPVYFQPSEAVKLTTVLLLAVALGERSGHARLPRWWPVLPSSALLVLLAQGDLGAALVVAMVVGLMLLGARGRGKWLAAALATAAVAAAAAYLYVPRAHERLGAWLDIWQDPYGVSYQIVQALRAIAGGGVAGRGLLAAESVFVPASHTDMILAAIGERLGAAGSLLVPALFLCLLANTRSLAKTASSATDALICLGSAALLVGQAFIIMAGSTAIIPLTGVTLPFVSYGGSSLLVCYGLLGALESRRRYSGSAHANGPLPRWHQAVYLGLAAAMALVALWLVVWHVGGSAILEARLAAS